MIHSTYILTLNGPDSPERDAILEPTLRETEENLTDLMAQGFWVEIHKWDDPLDDEVPNRELRDRISAYGEDDDE